MNIRKVIIDTNFLMLIGNYKVDIFQEIDRICSFEHEVLVLRETINELHGILKSDKGKFRKAAKLALSILKSKKIRIIEEEGLPFDDLILKICDKGTIVATEDRELRRQLKSKGVSLIILRQGKYLLLHERNLYK